MFRTLTPQNTTTPNADNINMDKSDDTLCSFERQDTYLHTFGIKNGNDLMKLLYSRITVCLLLLYGLFCLMLSWTNVTNYHLFLCLFDFMSWIWITFAILSVNRMALHLISKKFDFWIKIIFSIIFVISYSIWSISSHSKQNNESHVLFISHTILIGIDFILFITYYSMINGIQIKYKTKLYLGILLSSISTILIFQLLTYSANNSNRVNMALYDKYLSISWFDLTLSSIQILNIFLWKTVYLFRKYRGKSTIINTIPSIKWIEGKPLDISSLSTPPSSKRIDHDLESSQSNTIKSHKHNSSNTHHFNNSNYNKQKQSRKMLNSLAISTKLKQSNNNDHINTYNNNNNNNIPRSPNTPNDTMDIEITQSNNDNNCLYLDIDSMEFNPNNPKPLPLLPLITDTANRTEDEDPSCNDIPPFNHNPYSNTTHTHNNNNHILQLEVCNNASNQSRSSITPTPRSGSTHHREDRQQYNIIEHTDNNINMNNNNKRMRFPSNKVSPNYLRNCQQTPNHFSPSTAL